MFKYKKPRKKKPPVESIRPVQEGAPAESLTGYIQGIPADSMAEERFSRELEKSPKVAGYEYNFILGVEGMPGWKKMDFLVSMTDGRVLALSIKDLTFIHKGELAVAEDMQEEQYILEKLRQQQIYVDKVTTIDALDLDTQELASKKAKELL
jgi:hypothetical protein